MPEQRKPTPAGSTCNILVIDRSPRGLATADVFELRFPGLRQSLTAWKNANFEFLIFGSITVSSETTFIWAKDLDDLIDTAVPTLRLAMAERRLVPNIVIVVAPEIEQKIAAELKPQLH